MNVSKYVAEENLPVIDAMKKIDMNARGVLFICEEGKLIGVVTDGDIRRHILNNGDLKAPVGNIISRNPWKAVEGEDIDYRHLMKKNGITALPIVDEDGDLVRIEFLNKKIEKSMKTLGVPVAVMAGGKGTRLKPYTQVLPKPLIPIGEKTIMEHIMDRFENYGCNHFDIIVNYKKNLIKAFFMDAESKRDVTFFDEEEFLGTAGGLKLLSGQYTDTFFMTNCDVIIEEDYEEILKMHKKNNNIITMVCALKNVEIPYGTVEVSSDGFVTNLKEKPRYSLMTNTGLYVIEPRFLDKIPENTFIHITDVIQKCIDEGERVGVYPISEYAWMDMGQMEEMEKMRGRLEQGL